MMIKAVIARHKAWLLNISGVVAIGQGLCDGKPCIKVFVVKNTSELQENIPKKLEGYSVKIKETGVIQAQKQEKFS